MNREQYDEYQNMVQNFISENENNDDEKNNVNN